MATTADDRPFRHYTAKHRVVAWVSQHLFDRVTYTSRRGLLKGMKRKGGLGWVPEWAARAGMTPDERFWRGLDLTGLVVYDLGAFQGLLTLFFARQAKQVICYEPNSKNRARLLENVRLNNLGNVLVRDVGVGSRPGGATMVSSPLMPGGASLDPSIASRIRESGFKTAAEKIKITTLDQDILDASLSPPGFIKIDIEGWELEALRGAARTLERCAPSIFLEMHGETMNEKRRKAAEIVAFLRGLGYDDLRHVETGAAITSANQERAAEGHLYCRKG